MSEFAGVQLIELPGLESGYTEAQKRHFLRFVHNLPHLEVLAGLIHPGFKRSDGYLWADPAERKVEEGAKPFLDFRGMVATSSTPREGVPVTGFYIPLEEANRIADDGGPAHGLTRAAAALVVPYTLTGRLPMPPGVNRPAIEANGQPYDLRIVEIVDFMAGGLAVSRYGLSVDGRTPPEAIANQLQAPEGQWPAFPLERVLDSNPPVLPTAR